MQPPTPHQALLNWFGYKEFRPGQLDIIQAILKGRDTLAILPTGGGKSICFQVPGLVFGATTLVISPLISLMKDQVDSLRLRGIKATYLNSSLDSSTLKRRLAKLQKNHYRFVYVAPERLESKSFIQAMRKIPVNLVAIDEAHCLSQWGVDFRPHYRRIRDNLDKIFDKQTNNHLPKRTTQQTKTRHQQSRPVIAALTATATPVVQRDICNNLGLHKPFIFKKTFRRDNLTFNFIRCPNLLQKHLFLLRLLNYHRQDNSLGSGIIYVATRRAAHELKRLILYYQDQDNPNFTSALGIYHAGLSKQERQQAQTDFIDNKIKVIIATNAFGMGIDKPDIRFVIHYQIPASLEHYYQEIGRAGRDRQPSYCYLLNYQKDLNIAFTFIKTSNADKEQKLVKHQQFQAMLELAQTKSCRVKQILSYFGEEASEKCQQCDNCLVGQQDYSLSQSLFDIKEQGRLKKLAQLRLEMAQKSQVDPEYIISDTNLCWAACLNPSSKQAWLRLPGIGRGWLEKWNTFTKQATA